MKNKIRSFHIPTIVGFAGLDRIEQPTLVLETKVLPLN